MKKIVMGNWKMHGTAGMAAALARSVAQETANHAGAVQVVICPPACLLSVAAAPLAGSPVRLGGQDCHAQPEGAYTGATSALMLKDAGCDYVIVGHSERRQYDHESNEDVRAKAARAIKSGLIPVICIGETEGQRGSGKTNQILAEQINESIPDEAMASHFILAYEPVWAIGSGKTPTIDEIRQLHIYIIKLAMKKTGLDPSRIPVLYGGSVKASNAREIMALAEVSGVLVGGASLKAEEFCEIIKAAV